jgi:hypothetical protein
MDEAPVSQNWSRENIAWLAGLIEGEGCFYIQPGRTGSSLIKVQMTDEDVIRKCERIAGCGVITGPHHRVAGQKAVWTWTVARGKHVLALAYAIYPFMCSRRQAKLVTLVDRLKAMKKPLDRQRRHGTYSKYARGCRCDECKQAASIYRKAWWPKWQAKRREHKAPVPALSAG